MENSEFKKPNWEKISLIALCAVGTIILILLLWNIFSGNNSKMVQQQSHSDLINTKDISMLSVSEFVYNGIAQREKEDGSIDYNVFYKSTVKVSIDANKTEYTINEKEKKVTFNFPEFTVENPVIDVDSFSFIPSRNDLFVRDAIALCRNDALSEAKNSEKLISSAQENLKSIIEAWYSPVLEGYTFEYVFKTAEGGESK